MSELSQLRKENNELEKELTKENSDLITRMYFYLVSSSLKEIEVEIIFRASPCVLRINSSSLKEIEVEIIRKDLTGIALEAQERGESFADVIGEDYKRFCDELIANGRRKTPGRKLLEILELLLYAGNVLLIGTILLDGTMPGAGLTITPAFITSILFGVVCGTAVLWFLSRVVWGLPEENLRRNQILGYGGLFAALAGFILLNRFLPATELFTIDPYVVLVFGIAVLIIVVLIRRRQI